MQMTVNVAGQVGQIKLGQNKALWPLFETVINSIQSLEDTNTDQKKIIIEALRNPNVQLRMGISEYEQQNRNLAMALFSDGELSKENQEMLDYIIESGTFGTTKHSVQNRL